MVILSSSNSASMCLSFCNENICLAVVLSGPQHFYYIKHCKQEQFWKCIIITTTVHN